MSKGEGVVPKKEDKGTTITSLMRGLSVLRCFDRPRAEMTVSEIARRIGLAQATTWRLCQTLLEGGFLVKSENGASLRIGAPALTLGYSAIKGMDFREIALPYMRRLTERTRVNTTLSILQGAEVVSVDKVDGDFVRANEPIGWRAPVTTVPSGLAILARMSAFEREALLEGVPKSARHPERVEDACRQFAENGYVVHTGLLGGNYAALAVALRGPDGPDGPQFWTMSCGGLSAAWPEEEHEMAGRALRELVPLLEPAIEAASM